jgi:hypothetical protein
MNYGRLAGAAVAAFVVDVIYGFVVYGMLLQGQISQYPAIYRPPEDMSYMPYLMLGILIGTFTATYIYAKGYEGGPGAIEGARFGACVGVFVGGYIGLVNYAVMNLGGRITLSVGVAGFVEWVILGIVIGLVYKPSAVPVQRRAAGV